jgi:hypothetical protein
MFSTLAGKELNNFFSPSDVQNMPMKFGHYVYLTLSNPMSDLVLHYDFPVPDAFPHVVRILANR